MFEHPTAFLTPLGDSNALQHMMLRATFRIVFYMRPARDSERSYCKMERDDGTRSTHERLSHQRVMLGGPHDAQISVHRPRLSAQAHIWMGSPADTCGVCTVLAKKVIMIVL